MHLSADGPQYRLHERSWLFEVEQQGGLRPCPRTRVRLAPRSDLTGFAQSQLAKIGLYHRIHAREAGLMNVFQ